MWYWSMGRLRRLRPSRAMLSVSSVFEGFIRRKSSIPETGQYFAPDGEKGEGNFERITG
jgi:hypothetical protein